MLSEIQCSHHELCDSWWQVHCHRSRRLSRVNREGLQGSENNKKNVLKCFDIEWCHMVFLVLAGACYLAGRWGCRLVALQDGSSWAQRFHRQCETCWSLEPFDFFKEDWARASWSWPIFWQSELIWIWHFSFVAFQVFSTCCTRSCGEHFGQ